jgi:hypothetical protein
MSTHYGTVLHQSGALTAIQGDAIRNISGRLGTQSGLVQVDPLFQVYWASDGGYWGSDGGIDGIDFNASRVVPVANENRPVSTAVRYLIRALP